MARVKGIRLKSPKMATPKRRKVSLTKTALNELKTLPTPTQQAVLRAITKIAENPKTDISWRKLRMPTESPKAVWVKKVGLQSRIVFTFDDTEDEAEILAILTPESVELSAPRSIRGHSASKTHA